jgi:ATP-dependent metalloprotease
VDEITSGCSDDLNKATMMAYQFVKYLGMQEGLNLLCPGDIQTSDRFNE